MLKPPFFTGTMLRSPDPRPPNCAAMTPCPCGYRNNPRRDCRYTVPQVERYMEKMSGRMLSNGMYYRFLTSGARIGLCVMIVGWRLWS